MTIGRATFKRTYAPSPRAAPSTLPADCKSHRLKFRFAGRAFSCRLKVATSHPSVFFARYSSTSCIPSLELIKPLRTDSVGFNRFVLSPFACWMANDYDLHWLLRRWKAPFSRTLSDNVQPKINSMKISPSNAATMVTCARTSFFAGRDATASVHRN